MLKKSIPCIFRIFIEVIFQNFFFGFILLLTIDSFNIEPDRYLCQSLSDEMF